MEKNKLPLEGIRVLDFSWYAAGPIATKILAEFGAQVIKIESNTRVDGLRIGPPQPEGKSGPNVGGYFNDFNSSKLSITLNLSHPKARDIILRLVEVSDVVLDNFTPRVMQGWRLTYEDLVKVKPDIIALNMPLQGTDGPRKDYLGFGAAVQALSGISYPLGFPGRLPVGTGTNYPDFSSNPCHAAIAILCALRHRKKTGKGQKIEVSQFESTASLLETAILDYTVNKRIHQQKGNRLPYTAPHGAYRCKGDDRWCVIAVFNYQEWQAFCKVIGNPPWTEDNKFTTILGRKQNEDELDRLIEEWTSQRTPEEVMWEMQKAGVAAGVVQNAEDILTCDPQIKAREHYAWLDHPEAGRTAYDGIPYKLSLTPGKVRSPAPLLGEHNEYVCREVLKMSEEEINQYYTEGVFE